MNVLLTQINCFTLLESICQDGSIWSCGSENLIFTDISIFSLFFWKSKKRLAALFELFKNIEYVEIEDVTYNQKKKEKKTKTKTNAKTQLPTLNN